MPTLHLMSTATTKPNATPLPTPEERPGADVVIYDGQCRFCQAQVRRINWWDCQHRLSYMSLHDPEVARRWPDLTHDQLMKEMYIIEPSGARHRGAESLRYLTRRLRRLWWAAPFLHIPFSLPLWQWLYQQVAQRRYKLAGKDECDSGACQVHFAPRQAKSRESGVGSRE